MAMKPRSMKKKDDKKAKMMRGGTAKKKASMSRGGTTKKKATMGQITAACVPIEVTEV